MKKEKQRTDITIEAQGMHLLDKAIHLINSKSKTSTNGHK